MLVSVCTARLVLQCFLHHLTHFVPMTSHERREVSNYQLLDCLSNMFFKITPKTTSKIRPHHWPYGRGILRWHVDSPQNGPVMWKALPFCEVISLDNVLIVIPYKVTYMYRKWTYSPNRSSKYIICPTSSETNTRDQNPGRPIALILHSRATFPCHSEVNKNKVITSDLRVKHMYMLLM